MSDEQKVTADALIDWQSTATRIFAEHIRPHYRKSLGIDGYGNFFVEVNGKRQNFGSDADAACDNYNSN